MNYGSLLILSNSLNHTVYFFILGAEKSLNIGFGTKSPDFIMFKASAISFVIWSFNLFSTSIAILGDILSPLSTRVLKNYTNMYN